MPLPAFIGLALKLAPVVPLITRWLSGNDPGPLAEKIITVAQTVSGETTANEAVNAILGDPVKQQAFTLAMQDRTNDMERAFLADRQSARERDIKIITVKGKNQRGDFLAYMAIAALILCIVLLFIWEPPAQSRDLLLVVLGALVTIVKDVFSFEFGSSKNSERNMQTLSNYVAKNGK